MAVLRTAGRSIIDGSELVLTTPGVVVDEVRAQRVSLEEQDHRPWPLPDRPWLMGQTWNDLLFAHWPIEPRKLEGLLPRALELDLYDGTAWLGVTPFLLSGGRMRGTPPLPWLSRFPELNVRTYVEVAGKPGIYFLSLDAGRLAAVKAARGGYRLPYFHARMRAQHRGDQVHYESRRIDRDGPRAEFGGAYGPSGPRLPVEDGTLARWLAERYCAYVVDEQGHPCARTSTTGHGRCSRQPPR